MIRRLSSFLIALGMMIAPVAVMAQDSQSTEQQKAQAELQEKALHLLDQVASEAQALKLPENRLRVQWQVGDLYWERDEARARTLFSQVAAGLGEMIQGLDPSDRRYTELLQTPSQLRQEFIQVVARRDPKLAYNFLLATRPPAPTPPPNASPNAPTPNTGQQSAETSLEMNLLAQIAASDPALALQNAEAALDKGQFPSSLARMLAQLQEKDKGTAKKLEDKLLKKMSAETLLSNSSARILATSLLRPGPRLPDSQSSSASSQANTGTTQTANQGLDEAAYRQLLDVMITAALSVAAGSTGGQSGLSGLNGAAPAAPAAPGQSNLQSLNTQISQNNAQIARNNAQIAQNNATVSSLQSLLPQIDKYLPARSQAVRQKLAEMGIKSNPITIDSELSKLMREGSTDAILQAASRAATPEMQSMLYRQAASKAIDEGNLDRASQIATQYLDQKQRDSVAQSIERQKTLQNALAGKMEVARQTLATFKTDPERINWLSQAAAAAMKVKDQKLATQFLDEARNLAGRRVSNYQQFDLQLRVAHAYVNVEPGRGFEMIASGIDRLNELLTAAAVLSGFEMRVFKDDEMLLQGGTQLNNLVTRYGQELAAFARTDFERAQTAADGFQRGEARVAARLAIVRNLLAKSDNDMPTISMPPPPPMALPAPIIRTEEVR